LTDSQKLAENLAFCLTYADDAGIMRWMQTDDASYAHIYAPCG